MQRRRVFANFRSLKSRIALEVATKIASCDSAISMYVQSFTPESIQHGV